ncbi:helix-turn-helix domain-containing protein [Planotetraspora kaengkrachanensis]|uniref:Transcriptional regulator n=1 Tax=Planotetraspora kaengkrachanensis TaxID=575193 RepID=A0A8J3PU45_9ACTN|nr:helix-turn-helix transcriptional regulator [Planotetraspora kaengkrachanensis]GIG81080.1 transcriptional regulator [Planotetraspora kaengkrachanensis]
MTTAPTEGAQPHPRTPTAPPRTSTVLRILLGTQLRRLRESRNITLEEAGHAIRASHSKISRMELGRVSVRGRDVADLLTLYGVADEAERAAMLTLVSEAGVPGWWHNYGDIVPSWFEMYVGLEQAATGIRNYEVQFVPGLLQTEDYARSVIRLGHPDARPEDVERRVEFRMARQRVLTGPNPPHVWAVVDESVLRRSPGGPAVMRGQIARLLDLVARPEVTLQVVPFSAGGHAAAGGPFSIVRFADRDLPDVVYLEQLTSAVYLDKRDDVDHYLAVMERLCITAGPATDSRRILHEISVDL